MREHFSRFAAKIGQKPVFRGVPGVPPPEKPQNSAISEGVRPGTPCPAPGVPGVPEAAKTGTPGTPQNTGVPAEITQVFQCFPHNNNDLAGTGTPGTPGTPFFDNTRGKGEIDPFPRDLTLAPLLDRMRQWCDFAERAARLEAAGWSRTGAELNSLAHALIEADEALCGVVASDDAAALQWLPGALTAILKTEAGQRAATALVRMAEAAEAPPPPPQTA